MTEQRQVAVAEVRRVLANSYGSANPSDSPYVVFDRESVERAIAVLDAAFPSGGSPLPSDGEE